MAMDEHRASPNPASLDPSLDVVAEVSLSIRSNSVTNETLQSMAMSLTRILSAEGCIVWVLDPQRQTLEKASFYHEPEQPQSKAYEQKSLATRLKFGESLCGSVWAEGKAKLLEEPAMFAQCAQPGHIIESSPAPINTLAFPIYGLGTIYGAAEIIGVNNAHLDEHLRRLVEVLGTLIGAFLVSTSLESQLREANKLATEQSAVNRALHMSLEQAKQRLSSEHDQASQAAAANRERLRQISKDIRTPLNGIVGMLGLLQRISMPEPTKEYISLINDSVAALLRVIEDVQEIADREQSFQAAPADKVQDLQEKAMQQSPRQAFENERAKFTKSSGEQLTEETLSKTSGVNEQQEKADHPSAGIASRPVNHDLSKDTILVVTGLVGSAEFIEAYVSAAGIKCVSSSRGHSALTKLRQAESAGKPFDLVFVEMVLPDMDALEFARLVKQDSLIAKTRLVLVSTFGEAEKDDRAIGFGFSSHIAKPIKQAQVIATISDVLQDQAPPAIRTQIQKTAQSLKGKHTVLVAEDNPVNQKVALLQLKELGFLAQVVTNGKEAVEAIKAGRYDAVLMDCQMPMMDGFEATKEIRAWQNSLGNEHIPIIAMTAHALSADRDRCFAAGMDDYMSKPVTYEKLGSVLSRWVSLRDNRVAGDMHMTESAQPSNRELGTFTGPPPIDVSQLEEMLGPEETGEILTLFVSSTEDLLARIDSALAIKDSKALKEAAHELKGACASVGASGMAQSCFELEQAAKSEDWETAPRVQLGLNETFESARSYIQGLKG